MQFNPCFVSDNGLLRILQLFKVGILSLNLLLHILHIVLIVKSKISRSKMILVNLNAFMTVCTLCGLGLVDFDAIALSGVALTGFVAGFNYYVILLTFLCLPLKVSYISYECETPKEFN